MRSHFHLVAETPKASLISGMEWLLGAYPAGFNRKQLDLRPAENGILEIDQSEPL